MVVQSLVTITITLECWNLLPLKIRSSYLLDIRDTFKKCIKSTGKLRNLVPSKEKKNGDWYVYP